MQRLEMIHQISIPPASSPRSQELANIMTWETNKEGSGPGNDDSHARHPPFALLLQCSDAIAWTTRWISVQTRWKNGMLTDISQSPASTAQGTNNSTPRIPDESIVPPVRAICLLQQSQAPTSWISQDYVVHSPRRHYIILIVGSHTRTL